MHRLWNATSKMKTRLPPRLLLDAPMPHAPASGKAESRKNVHILSGSQGQSLVEFALVLPILVILLIGAIEVGRAAYYSIEVTNASYSAVEYGSQTPATAGDDNGIIQAALNEAPTLSPDNVTKSIYYECPDGTATTSVAAATDCAGAGGRFFSYLEVNTQMDLMPLFGFPGFPTVYSLKGNASERIRN
jgi:Flp pilus assembly protein TadG